MKTKKYEIGFRPNERKIIICGKGGSGKNFLRNKFHDKGYLIGKQCTTRPKRPSERDGFDYYFIDRQFYYKYKATNKIIEEGMYNNWLYFTHKHEYTHNDVFIFPPSSILNMPLQFRRSAFVIYLDVPDDIIHARLLDRVKKEEWGPDWVTRRMENDRNDFAEFKDYDLRITNPDF